MKANGRQVLIQLCGIAVTLVWSGVATFALLKAIDFVVSLRVKPQDEVEGLDVTQHGEAFAIVRTPAGVN